MPSICKMEYRISEKALKDIEDIWLHTLENWSVEQADRYYNLIFDEIQFIATHFDQGKNYGNVREGYRYSKVKSHLIFYRKSNDKTVEIIRVLHEKMDILNRLDD